MRPPSRITIRGIEYPSHLEAAKALGVSVQSVYQAKHHGRLDRIGLEKVRRFKPVVIRGVEYPSMAEAAKAHGVGKAAVSLAAKLGRLDTVGTGTNWRKYA